MIKVNTIDYLYYKLNTWLSYLTISGQSSGGLWVPSLLLGFNVSCILNITTRITEESRITISAIVSIFMAFYYLCKDEQIMTKYELESDEASSRGTKAVILYIILSIALLYVSENYF